MRIEAVTPTIGAEVSGVDLSQPLSADLEDQLYEALMRHLVLFFRDQDLSPEAQYDFATRFGEPVPPHPVYPHLPGFDRVVLLENDGDRPPDTDDWHSDLTFQQKPPFLSVLHAIDVAGDRRRYAVGQHVRRFRDFAGGPAGTGRERLGRA